VVLPLSAPPANNADRWIVGALADVRRKGKPLTRAAQELLAATFAPGTTRSDGLPAYSPYGPHAGGAEAAASFGTLQRPFGDGSEEDYDHATGRTVYREIVDYDATPVFLADGRQAQCITTTWRKRERSTQRGMGRNTTLPIREIVAAVCRDILDLPMYEIGPRILGQRPNRDPEREAAGKGARVTSIEERSSSWRSGSASPYEASARGRSILAQLGCWPWAHVSEGKLSRRWREEPEIIEPLQRFVAAQVNARSTEGPETATSPEASDLVDLAI